MLYFAKIFQLSKGQLLIFLGKIFFHFEGSFRFFNNIIRPTYKSSKVERQNTEPCKVVQNPSSYFFYTVAYCFPSIKFVSISSVRIKSFRVLVNIYVKVLKTFVSIYRTETTIIFKFITVNIPNNRLLSYMF